MGQRSVDRMDATHRKIWFHVRLAVSQPEFRLNEIKREYPQNKKEKKTCLSYWFFVFSIRKKELQHRYISIDEDFLTPHRQQER